MFAFRPLSEGSGGSIGNSGLASDQERCSNIGICDNSDCIDDNSHLGNYDGDTRFVRNPLLDSSGDVTDADSNEIKRLLRPVKERTFSREAEEVRITTLHRHALRISSEVDSSLTAIPLLESIVQSFVLRTPPILPSHLLAIKFASCKLLGNLYLKSKNPEAALKKLTMAVELDSTDLSIWLKLANTSIELCQVEQASSALLHILNEQPSHPLAHHLALPFFLAVSNFELCLELGKKTLFLDPQNEPALYCMQRALSMQPSLDYLLGSAFTLSDVLKVKLSEECQKQMDARVNSIRERYLAQIRQLKEAEILKTIRFPRPLARLSWEHLIRAVVRMFDKLNAGDSILSPLDLGSLFNDGVVPPPPPDPMECSPPETAQPSPSGVNVKPRTPVQADDSEGSGSSTQVPQLTEEAPPSPSPICQPHTNDIPMLDQTSDVVAAAASAVGDFYEYYPRTSKRTRRSALAGGGGCGTTDDSSHQMSSNAGAGGADGLGGVAATITGLEHCSAHLKHNQVGTADSPQAKTQRQQWIDRASRFRGVLPTCFREVASLCEREEYFSSNDHHTSEKPHRSNRVSDVEEDELPVVGEQSVITPYSEEEMVTKFLRILESDSSPNIVLLCIALLLQMTSLNRKPWSRSFATAYLALAGRTRPCLPLYTPGVLPSEPTPDPQSARDNEVLSAALLCLRSRPWEELLIDLHMAYVEVRLDALAAHHDHKRKPTQVSPIELLALQKALDFDTARLQVPDDIISMSDLARVLQSPNNYPEDSKEAVALRGRALWVRYEMDAVLQDYAGMEVCLNQAKDFVAMHGSIRRIFSFRNPHITMTRIDELLSELKDISSGERLEGLCKHGFYNKLVKAVGEVLKSHVTSLKAGKSALSHFGVHTENLPRVCAMLKLPLITLIKKLRATSSPASGTDDVDESSVEDAQQVPLALRCWRLGKGVLSFLLESSVDFDRLAAFWTLPDDERASVAEAWSVATTTFEMLQKCWEIIDSQMKVLKHSTATDLTLEAVAKLDMFSQELLLLPTAGKKSAMSRGRRLTFGQACSSLRTVVDAYAWRLQATGVLGLPPPPLSLQFVGFLYESLDRLECAFPIQHLHPILIVHRALCEFSSMNHLEIEPEDVLLGILTTKKNSSCPGQLSSSANLLVSARGHNTAAPAVILLHLFHEQLCAMSETIQRGCLLRFLRNAAVTVARVLQQLSSGYLRVQKRLHSSDEDDNYDDDNETEVPLRGQEECAVEALGATGDCTVILDSPRMQSDETTEQCAREASVTSSVNNARMTAAWPDSTGVCMGEVLAQIIHCLCGLPVSISTRAADAVNRTLSSSMSSSASVGSSPNSCRFKQVAPPPTPRCADAHKKLPPNAGDTNCLAESFSFTALPPTAADMPLSCVLPVPPLWMTDGSLFYETVEDHGGSLATHQQQSATRGIWWSVGNTSILDWQIIELAFVFYRPATLPEYDSMRSLSISTELFNWLLEAVKLLPKDYEPFMLTLDQIQSCLHTRSPIPRQNYYLSDMVNLMYYLLADFYTKNNTNFDRAIEFYIQDLRVAPHHADTWAALALIYSSQLEQILNVTDPKTERVTSRSVTACLRCFDVALQIQPRFVTLLTERGCLAYQLHSYSARMVKKSLDRSFTESHLQLCRQWQRAMLLLAHRSYSQAHHIERTSSLSTPRIESHVNQLEMVTTEFAATEVESEVEECPQEKATKTKDNNAGVMTDEEEWLYHYMLTKCDEKAGPGGLQRVRSSNRGGQAPCFANGNTPQPRESYADWVIRVVSNYQKAADVLHASGAKYPKKIVVYNKLPFLAVEAIEVFYRTHAFVLKVLLKEGEPGDGAAPSRLPLRPIYEALEKLNQSAFVTEPAKFATKSRSRKRPSTMLEPPPKAAKSDATPSSDDQPPPTAMLPRSQNQHQQPQQNSDAESTPETGSQPPARMFFDKQPQSEAELWKFSLMRCREAMELVLRRLPLHYKAMYRLAHLYLTLSSMRDLDKAMAILMGPFDHVTKVEYGGLFKDRRQNNFFYGVWRIPTADIDRSGNFAAHMFRSTSMVLEVLHQRSDWYRLLQVFHQLRKQPPDDKRGFLSEGDRVFLARRAFSLIGPTLRIWLTTATATSASYEGAEHSHHHKIPLETLCQIYRLFAFAQTRSATGTSPKKEKEVEGADSDVSGFMELLSMAYRLCPSAWLDASSPGGLSVEAVVKRCAELANSSTSLSSSSSLSMGKSPTKATLMSKVTENPPIAATSSCV